MLSTTSVNLGFLVLILISLILPFLVHLLIVRVLGLFKEKALRQKGAIVSIPLGFIPLLLLFYLWEIRGGRTFGTGILWPAIFLFGVYLLFAYVYFHLFNMSETARRIRILAQSSPHGRIEKDEMEKHYTGRQMLAIRLERLVSLKELRLTEGRYTIRRGWLLLPATVVFAFRRILFPPEGTVSSEQ